MVDPTSATDPTAELERRRREMALLFQADEKLHQKLELDGVLQALVDVAVELLEADKSSLLVWDERRERLVARAARGFKPETVAAMSFAPGEGSVGRVAASGEAVAVANVADREEVLTHVTDAEGIRSFMHFPITVRGRIFGVFNVDYLAPRTFSADTRRLFTALTRRAALAIENAQLYEEEQARRAEAERRRQIAEGLRGILAILNSRRPLSEILDYIATQASLLMGPETAVALFRYDHLRDSALLLAQHALPDVLAALPTVPISFVGGTTLKERRPLIVNEVAPYVADLLQQSGDIAAHLSEALVTFARLYHSYLSVPLVVDGAIYGGLAFHFTTPRALPQSTVDLALALSDQAALAIENARLQSLEQERRAVAEGLRETIRAINSSRPLQEVLDVIVTQASRLMGAAVCTLHQVDYEADFVYLKASHGLPPALDAIDGFPLLSSEADRRILNREAVAIADVRPPVLTAEDARQMDPRVRRWREGVVAHHAGFLAVPLIVDDAVYGSLAFYFRIGRPFTPETIELARSLAEQAALAIANAALRRQAEQAAVTAERNRLARELHDAVTQTLFSTSLIADVLPRIWERDPATGREKLAELRELTRSALAEMRTLLLELRPAALQENSLQDLLTQLTSAVAGRTRLRIDVTVTGDRPVPPDVKVALYRIAQEALNNIVKHADATEAALTVALDTPCITLTVVDNGRGFDPAAVPPSTLGLGIMQERAARLNATLTVDSVIGRGTTVRLRACP